MQRLIQRRLGAAALLALLGLLAACGGNDSSPSSSGDSSSHNDADVSFATNMIPHHAQAIQMAKMAVTNATSSDVVNLADKIRTPSNPKSTRLPAG